MSDHHVGTVAKNRSETIHVTLTEYRGVDLCDVRVHASYDGRPAAPTRKGVSVNVHVLPELVRVLAEAEAVARAEGLLPSSASPPPAGDLAALQPGEEGPHGHR